MTGLMRHSLSKLGIYVCLRKSFGFVDSLHHQEEVSKWSLKKILIIYNILSFFFSLRRLSHTHTKKQEQKSFGFDSLHQEDGVKMVFEKKILIMYKMRYVCAVCAFFSLSLSPHTLTQKTRTEREREKKCLV